MKANPIFYEFVNPDGTIPNAAGAIEVKGSLILSHHNGGCGLPNCPCSPGHWLTMMNPRNPDTGSVDGVQFDFDSRESMVHFVEGMLESFKSGAVTLERWLSDL